MRLALLGDIALFGKMSLANNSNWKDYFSDVSDVLSGFDLVVGNLETPFSIKKKTFGAKSAYIGSDVENVDILKFLHVKAVSLANNHIFDYGTEGYEKTKMVLNDNDISWFGSEGKELLLNIGTNKLAFVGFCCYSSNPLQCVSYGSYGVNEFDVGKAMMILEQRSHEGYLPILSVHAGVEHVNYPSCDTIRYARMMAEKCPMVYYGHHPHVVQGMQQIDKSFVAYSLGNFCFDDVYSSVSKKPLIALSENNKSSCILVLTIEGNQVITHEIIPIYIGRDRLIVGKGVGDSEIKLYSDTIVNMSHIAYCEMRQKLISDYTNQRKSNRDMLWYLKRLRPRYFFIMQNAKRNKKNYQRCVTDYLNK